MRTKVLLTRLWPHAVLNPMSEKYDITFDSGDRPLPAAVLHQAMAMFDVICAMITDCFERSIFEQSKRWVRLIANFGAGVEHIDLAAANQVGAIVTNTPNVLKQSTAELALLLMLMTARRAAEDERQLCAARWPGFHPTHMTGRSLYGKRLGLIGYGRIAQATAKMAKALWDMEIGHYGWRCMERTSGIMEAAHFSSLPVLLESSNVVSVHCTGGAEPHHLLNAPMLA